MATILTTITPPSNAKYSIETYPSSPYTVYIEYDYSVNQDTAVYTITHALKLRQDTNTWDFETVGKNYAGYWVSNWGTATEYSKTQKINIDDKGNKGYTITLASGTSYVQANRTTGEAHFYVKVNFSINADGYGPGKIYRANTRINLPTLDRNAPVCYCAVSDVRSDGFTVTASANEPCTDYWYQIDDDSTWHSIAANQAYYTYSKSKNVSAEQGLHRIRTRVRRSWNDIDGYSDWVAFNNSLPNVYNDSCKALDDTRSQVSFYVDYPCKYAITNSTTKPSMTISVAEDTLTTVNYDVTKNSINTRYLYVIKDNNYSENLYRYIPLETDNILPVISLAPPQISGNQVALSATSDVDVKNWYVQYRKVGNSAWTTKLIATTKSRNISFVLGDDETIDINIEYEYRVFATKDSNGLTNYSSISKFKCLGTGTIYINNQPELATAYIYSNTAKQFKSSVPYIYDSSFDNEEYTDDRKHWRQTF